MSAYGRGVIEGLRMAGVPNPGDFMNVTKLARLESGLNSMAKKVLDVVPLQEPWSKDQIASELRRIGSSADRTVVEGCLNTLCERGVVKEPTRGYFIRITARQPAPITKEINPVSTTNASQPASAPPVEAKRLVLAFKPEHTYPGGDRVSLACRMESVIDVLRQASDELLAVAIEYEEAVEQAGKDGEKLRQLQALLKSLG
jgi:hypothetical protein